MFDQFYFNVFRYYKKSLKQKANSIAVIYITILQASLILFFGVLFALFSKQMYLDTVSSASAWSLFIISSVVIYFKNWLQYSGKKRLIINVKLNKSTNHNIILLLILPVAIIFLSIILLNTL